MTPTESETFLAINRTLFAHLRTEHLQVLEDYQLDTRFRRRAINGCSRVWPMRFRYVRVVQGQRRTRSETGTSNWYRGFDHCYPQFRDAPSTYNLLHVGCFS